MCVHVHVHVCVINIQFAVRGSDVYVLEANPRASRTVPFISKATGVPLAKVATRVMMGERLGDLRAAGMVPSAPGDGGFVAVKEAVLPWKRFPAEDTVLGPEMRATGEVTISSWPTGTVRSRTRVTASVSGCCVEMTTRSVTVSVP